jgi:hypothetical protein
VSTDARPIVPLPANASPSQPYTSGSLPARHLSGPMPRAAEARGGARWPPPPSSRTSNASSAGLRGGWAAHSTGETRPSSQMSSVYCVLPRSDLDHHGRYATVTSHGFMTGTSTLSMGLKIPEPLLMLTANCSLKVRISQGVGGGGGGLRSREGIASQECP